MYLNRPSSFMSLTTKGGALLSLDVLVRITGIPNNCLNFARLGPIDGGASGGRLNSSYIAMNLQNPRECFSILLLPCFSLGFSTHFNFKLEGLCSAHATEAEAVGFQQKTRLGG